MLGWRLTLVDRGLILMPAVTHHEQRMGQGINRDRLYEIAEQQVSVFIEPEK